MTDTDHESTSPDQPRPPAPDTDEAPIIPLSPLRDRRRPYLAASAVLVLLFTAGISAVTVTGGGQAIRDDARMAAGNPRPSPTSAPPSSSPTATTPAPTSAAPTTTAPTTTAPPTPATPKPKVISGRGDDVVRIAPLTDLAVVVFKCPRCTGNTVLHSDGPDSLLVNEIGAYSGKRWINLEENAQTTQFEVEATGRWTLTIGTVAQLATQAMSGKASGRGDDVLVLGGSASAARITHSKGRSNFAIHAYSLDTGEGGRLVNEIGGYSGVRPLSAPALVQVTADGNWTISPA